MDNKDVLFANKVLELRLIDQKKLKNCHTVQEQLKKQGKNFTLSQVTIKLGFITPQQALSIHNLIKEMGNQPLSNATHSDKITNTPPVSNIGNLPQLQNTDITMHDSPTAPPISHLSNGSALFTSSTVQSYPRATLDINDTFHHYIIEKKLGQGGMGAVYQVRDDRLGRSVALKVIIGSGALSEKQVQRFLTEARATASLKHPNIVEVYEIGSQPQNYFTMELVQGRSLSALIRSRNLTPQKAAIIMAKCSKAIHYAHKQGIIHRDIKPSNIMMERNKEPKIMDFGLAKDVESEEKVSTTGNVLGTLCYMSPEQANGKETDARSDIYSLGASLYEVLCKRPPFQGEDSMNLLCQVFTEDPIELRLLNPDIPKDLEAICLKCLHKKAEKRYQTAKQLADDLENFVHNRPVKAQPITRWIRIKKSIARNKMLTLFMLFAFASLSAIAVLAESGKREEFKARQTAEQQRQKALEAKKEAEDARVIAEEALKDAEEARFIAEEAQKEAERERRKAEEALYKASIGLAKGHNDNNRIADVNIALKQAKKSMPKAETFWEYRWQKNRQHYEQQQIFSQTIRKIDMSNNLLIAIDEEGAFLFDIEKKTTKLLFTGKYTKCCAISPDGLQVAVGDLFGSIFIWNTKTFEKKQINVAESKPKTHRGRFSNTGQQIQDLVFSSDGSKLLVARQTINEVRSENFTNFVQSLLVINTNSNTIVKRFSIPKEYLGMDTDRRDKLYRKFIDAHFVSCDFSSDQKIIIGAADDRYVYAYSKTKKTRFFGPHEARILSCKVHPKNSRLIASASGRTVHFWDYNIWNPLNRKRQKEQQSLKTLNTESRINSLDFSHDGTQIILGTENGQIHLWKIKIIKRNNKIELALSKNDMIFSGHTKVNTCIFANNKSIYSAGDGIKFWNTKIYKKPLKKSLKNAALFALFHNQKDTVITSSLTSVILLNSKSGEKAKVNNRHEVFMHLSNVSHAQISKKQILYTSGFDGSINVCDLQKFQRLQINSIMNKIKIAKFALVNNETQIIAVSDRAQIHILQLNDQGLIGKKKSYKINYFINNNPKFAKMQINERGNLTHISFNKKNLVAITTTNRWLYLFNTNTMQLENIFDVKSSNGKCFLEYDPQTKANYIFLSNQNKITKYKIVTDTLQKVAELVGHTLKVSHMAKDPNNGRMISCGEDGSIHFWPKTGTQIDKSRTINPYFTLTTSGVFTFCSFDRSGDKIVAVGGDDTHHFGGSSPFIMVWDASQPNELKKNK
ncbi:protein kinase domain-containing protein [Candidatus Uabimicrobium amorphum]|uniref:non-specific serine/threonine protein kinase n=1 Tax=Uabimicrobium amorphum TaxID=2596890 RepID=A0A5S9IQD7_UABAM|nr:protein kinase [Candidatus Uabimicrobium amorphum]BBM84765.1 protein kinase [Candidatus Uabimicrobium amorphum]